jgi:hypothetical protein
MLPENEIPGWDWWFDPGENEEFAYYINISDELSPQDAPELFLTLLNPGLEANQARVEVEIVSAEGCAFSQYMATHPRYIRDCVRRKPNDELYIERIDYEDYSGSGLEEAGVLHSIYDPPLAALGGGDGAGGGGLALTTHHDAANNGFSSARGSWDNLSRNDPWSLVASHHETGNFGCEMTWRTVWHEITNGGYWLEHFAKVRLWHDGRTIRTWPEVSCIDDFELCLPKIKAQRQYEACHDAIYARQTYPELKSFPGSCAEVWNHVNEEGELETCPASL